MSWWYNDRNIVKNVWHTDRQTDRQTERGVLRAAWSQLKQTKKTPKTIKNSRNTSNLRRPCDISVSVMFLSNWIFAGERLVSVSASSTPNLTICFIPQSLQIFREDCHSLTEVLIKKSPDYVYKIWLYNVCRIKRAIREDKNNRKGLGYIYTLRQK